MTLLTRAEPARWAVSACPSPRAAPVTATAGAVRPWRTWACAVLKVCRSRDNVADVILPSCLRGAEDAGSSLRLWPTGWWPAWFWLLRFGFFRLGIRVVRRPAGRDRRGRALLGPTRVAGGALHRAVVAVPSRGGSGPRRSAAGRPGAAPRGGRRART